MKIVFLHEHNWAFSSEIEQCEFVYGLDEWKAYIGDGKNHFLIDWWAFLSFDR